MIRPSPTTWSDHEADRYLRMQARSDDVHHLGRALRRRLRGCRSLIDVGAGGGALGASIIPRGGSWRGIEPNARLAEQLAATMLAHNCQSQVIRQLWEDIDPHLLPQAEVVLAARVPGIDNDPLAAWRWCSTLATRAVAWVISATPPTGGLGLGAFLPAWLRDPRELISVDAVLAPLAGTAPTPHLSLVDWTWREHFVDYATAYTAFALRIAHPSDSRQLAALDVHLRGALTRTTDGFIASVPRRSAVCVFALG